MEMGNKNMTLAEFKAKRARFDEKATLPDLNKRILTASYKVAQPIACFCGKITFC